MNLHGLKVKAWRVDYVNQTNKTITEADFVVYANEYRLATLTDHGEFAPGVEINHGIGASDIIKEGDETHCVPTHAVFSDGSSWDSGLPNAATVIVRQPDSPVRIDACKYGYTNPEQAHYDIDIAVSFTNTSRVGATAVRFVFVGYDSFDAAISTWEGTIHGEFSPGVLINPGYNVAAYTRAGPQPGDAAWRIFNIKTTDVVRIECSVDAVRFADDTKWARSKGTLP